MSVYRTLTIACCHCGVEQSFDIFSVDYDDWQAGELAQIAFPYLSPGQREMMISETCDTCWDKMFGFGDDEE